MRKEAHLQYPWPDLVSLLRSRSESSPNQLAFTYLEEGEREAGTLTYGELDRQARAIAALLQREGGVNQRVLLLYPNGLEFIAAFFGCLYAGAIAVPAYGARQSRALERLLAMARDSGATLILSTADMLGSLKPAWSALPELQALETVPTDELEPGQEDTWIPPALTPDSIAFLQYTSGSTSLPKGVMVTHRNLLYNSEVIRCSFGLSPASRSVSWLPVFHDMGLIDGILQPVHTGFPAWIMAPLAFLQRPFRWLQAIARYRATHSGGPNFGYDLCVRKVSSDQLETLDLSCWLTAYNGAEPVRAETLRRFAARFAPCGFRPAFAYPCYGLAEATLMVTGGLVDVEPTILTARSEALEHGRFESQAAGRELVSCGQPRLETRVCIVDPETMEGRAPGSIGEIWVSGPTVAAGYWERPEETAKTFQAMRSDTGEGPFLRTGDLGFFAGAELIISGRLKDVIILRGRNLYPQDIEQVIESAHGAIRSGCSAAFSVDLAGEESLVVACEVEARTPPSEFETIQDACRMAISLGFEVPVKDVVLLKVGALPKTSSGKIQRRTCKHHYLASTLERAERPPLKGEPHGH